jgi:catechol 2,3-dioxygenase-like lactoylglutathione lyase family enzyme
MQHLRIARPVSDLQMSAAMYCAGLGLDVLARFDDHDGFDGVMLGRRGGSYHLEFTRYRGHPIAPSPTPEDLLVLYIPDQDAWSTACRNMQAAGFRQVPALNPYWELRGRTFEDHDGYRTVLERSKWGEA